MLLICKYNCLGLGSLGQDIQNLNVLDPICIYLDPNQNLFQVLKYIGMESALFKKKEASDTQKIRHPFITLAMSHVDEIT